MRNEREREGATKERERERRKFARRKKDARN